MAARRRDRGEAEGRGVRKVTKRPASTASLCWANEEASGVGGLQFGQVREQLLFIRKTDEVIAHHLVRAAWF